MKPTRRELEQRVVKAANAFVNKLGWAKIEVGSRGIQPTRSLTRFENAVMKYRARLAAAKKRRKK